MRVLAPSSVQDLHQMLHDATHPFFRQYTQLVKKHG